jgi:hypothetical protein
MSSEVTADNAPAGPAGDAVSPADGKTKDQQRVMYSECCVCTVGYASAAPAAAMQAALHVADHTGTSWYKMLTVNAETHHNVQVSPLCRCMSQPGCVPLAIHEQQ